eukprot:CAMPEP_0177648470 /NCGR_PEP_ID=MMETSP0447-20121125/10845_1 /TAXON_ID=0 /ORGANISM="Stygamoeba regulata, Strain BSH-02190019" /LENGTH=197 /DNA_ID=CAMNT_0019151113 /DNA_START=103 /DNA_END=696 /DNA_ORIENTATION=+
MARTLLAVCSLVLVALASATTAPTTPTPPVKVFNFATASYSAKGVSSVPGYFEAPGAMYIDTDTEHMMIDLGNSQYFMNSTCSFGVILGNCMRVQWTFQDQVRGYSNVTFTHQTFTEDGIPLDNYMGLALDIYSYNDQIGVQMQVDSNGAVNKFIYAQNWPLHTRDVTYVGMLDFTQITMGKPAATVFDLPSACDGV